MAYTYLHLDLDERRRIYGLHAKKLSVDAIARELGRHRSTISWELKRNAWIDPEHKAYNGYFPVTAQDLARDQRRRQRKLLRHSALRHSVADRLHHGWSPEQIAGRLKRDELSPVRVCCETIYQFTTHVNIVRKGMEQFAHVTVGGLNMIKVFCADTFEQVASIPVDALPHGLWPSGDGTRVYVGLENADAAP